MLDQQRKYISETTSKDEQLKKALEEISTLNKKLAEERTESEEKVRKFGKFALHFLNQTINSTNGFASFSIHHCQLYDLLCSSYLFALKCINKL